MPDGLRATLVFRANPNLQRDLEPRLNRVLQTLLNVVLRTAQQRTPVDTGRARASFGTRVLNARRPGVVRGQVGSDVEYVQYLENGTRNLDGSQRTVPFRMLRTGLADAVTYLARRS